MKALSLSKSTPSSGKGNSDLAHLMAAITRTLSRVRTGTHSVQPVAITVSTIVCTKLPDEEVLTAHVPLPLAEKVDQIAARLERSRGWIVKQALTAWVDQEEERRRLTLEALADVDAGRVIDHQAVQAWAEKS